MKRGLLNIVCLIVMMASPSFANNLKSNFNKNSYLKGVAHPVHISYTNIEYNQEEKKFKILFKLFVDDFDKILQIKFKRELNLVGGRWEKSYSQIVDQYVLEHFKLIVNGKDKTKSSLKFTDKQISENSIWLYYDFNTKEKSNKFEVFNSLMMDLYMDQSNLLIFTYLNQQKAIKLNQSKTNETFLF